MKKKKEATVVRGIRASDKFWKQATDTAKKENRTRNDLVVAVVSDYCNYQEYLDEQKSK